MKRSRFLLVLVVVAFLLRLGAVVALRGLHVGPTDVEGADGQEYSGLAWQVATGHGYTWDYGKPTAFRAPGFPFYLAGIYSVVGRNYPITRLSFCLLGALACFLTYWLARELLSEYGARMAAVLAAFYLPHVYTATMFESENLFVPLLALGVWAFIRHLKTGSAPLLALAGLALGWATLTRAFSFFLLPLLGLILLLNHTPRLPVRFAYGTLFAATFLAVILPWTARNYRVFGKPALVSTNGGSTFTAATMEKSVLQPTCGARGVLPGAAASRPDRRNPGRS